MTVQDGQVSKTIHGGGSGYGLDYRFTVGPSVMLPWLREWAAMSERERAHGSFVGISEPEWLGDLLCEGAVLVDVDQRVLLVFSEQPWRCRRAGMYSYRAAMMEGLIRTWPGWRIEWAYDGLADLLRYLGEDPTQVRDDDRGTPQVLYPDGRDDEDLAIQTLVTVADVDGCRAYGLGGGSAEPWRYGPGLLGMLSSADEIAGCPDVPQMGLHLDVPTRRAGLWSILPLCGAREDWPRTWPGWELEWWEDRYTEQVARSGGVVTVPSIDFADGLRDIAERVEHDWPYEEETRVYRDFLSPPGPRIRDRFRGNKTIYRVVFKVAKKVAKAVAWAAKRKARKQARTAASLVVGNLDS